MRPPPGRMPGKLPSTEVAGRNIKHLVDKARERLSGLSLRTLLEAYGDGSPKWLTGSTVWLPAVYDMVEYDTDLDIVFQDREACQFFAEGTLEALNREIATTPPTTAPTTHPAPPVPLGGGKYTMSSNRWGSGRIVHPDGKHVMDIWSLETDESIAELLMSYPEAHQRCAYFLSWNAPDASMLTRIVKVRDRMTPARTGGYRR
jgi:hypothetical protein